MKLALLFALTVVGLQAETLIDCKTVFVAPMPEGMDRFVSSALVKWGQLPVFTDPAKANCSLRLPAGRLPESDYGFWTAKTAALEMIHVESSAVVWADATTDNWSAGGGAKALGEKLVGRLKKAYTAASKKAAKPH